MTHAPLPIPIEKYLAAKGGTDVDEILSCFTEDATVSDVGEDRELIGTDQIRGWLSNTVAGYKLTSELRTFEPVGDSFVASIVVSGDFPGSPYEFLYRFTLSGDKIAALIIEPIGSLAP
ncbi:MAG TPA: nuclear transport factor 2 family protein [Fimbriimonas sp.]|nr:nuclear transport factor 2 family protein [Fimbriimonas sp.]